MKLHIALLLVAPAFLACGGKVVFDEGSGGAGTSSVTNSSVTTSKAASSSVVSSNASSSSTGMPLTGCAAFCTAAGSCEVGDSCCVSHCEKVLAAASCANEAKAYFDCATLYESGANCDDAHCAALKNAYYGCHGNCLQGCGGSTAGCGCSASCGDTEVEAYCVGYVECHCLINGQDVATCASTSPLNQCDVYQGCCASTFALPPICD